MLLCNLRAKIAAVGARKAVFLTCASQKMLTSKVRIVSLTDSLRASELQGPQNLLLSLLHGVWWGDGPQEGCLSHTRTR